MLRRQIYSENVETMAMYFVDITCDVQSVVLELGQLHVEFLEEIIEVFSNTILIIIPDSTGKSCSSWLINLKHIFHLIIYPIWLDNFTQMTFALFVQENSFGIVPFPYSLAQQGPFSVNKAIWDEHPEYLNVKFQSTMTSEIPGPPVSQTTRGSVDGLDLDSKSQKK